MLRKGSVVRSLAGRDEGRLLAVMETGDKTVTVCDGKERPLENPKKKNIRHLCDTGLMLSEHDADSNKLLRKALAGFAERV